MVPSSGGGIEPGRERGGDADELVVFGERAIDRAAVAIDDVERVAVKAPEQPVPALTPIRPNGNPPRIVEKRIGEDDGSGVVLTRLEGANFHAAIFS